MERIVPPGLERGADEPDLPEGYDESTLPFGVRAELRGLSKQLAGRVGGHLAAAAELVDLDPALALRHALVARRLASRLPVVREAAAEAAYAAGEFGIALTEYRAIHRMTGNDDYLPVIADCERAVGKPQAALRTLREANHGRLSAEQRIEAILVEAGTRDDLGQRPEAQRLLKEAIEARRGGRRGQARLRFAYAELLHEAGQESAARDWFASADAYDDQGELEVSRRIAELDGIEVPEGSDDGYDDEFEVVDVDVETDEAPEEEE
ncbi:tetratricopeptide repeat protein [Brooklawnia cerclae]|uniref:Tetratricopeptide (TPR) repeat protein n=1 Tax=Brooklawnia cerclae TaxID=349934 RepID=A0ABX0SH95_9ACTN|nr:tetratricopeptide (TPR) repeat protein [Brooklawnia cerclae]